MGARMSLKEASEITGLPPQAIREHMKRRYIDIGYVVEGKKNHRYVIFREKVMELIGSGRMNEMRDRYHMNIDEIDLNNIKVGEAEALAEEGYCIVIENGKPRIQKQEGHNGQFVQYR